MRSLKTTLTIVATALFASPALAQEVGNADTQRGGWIAIMMAIVLVMCIVAISILSSRREHRD